MLFFLVREKGKPACGKLSYTRTVAVRSESTKAVAVFVIVFFAICDPKSGGAGRGEAERGYDDMEQLEKNEIYHRRVPSCPLASPLPFANASLWLCCQSAVPWRISR